MNSVGSSTQTNATLISFTAYGTGGATGVYLGNVASSISNGAGNLVFGRRSGVTSFAESMRINTSGNVGIGTNNPSTRLTISKPIDSSSYGSGTRMIDFKSYFPGYDEDTVKASIYCGVSDDGSLNTQAGYMAFMTADGNTTPTERMRIERSGFVGIGMNNPDAQLYIRGTTSANGTVQIVAASSGKNMDCMALQKGGGSHIIGFRDGTSVMGQIRANGSGGLAYDTSSEERLKENIVDMNSMINKVMSIKCREYDWKESKKHDFGFIAQEIYELFPHLRPDVSCYCDCSDNCFDKDEPVDKKETPIIMD